MNEPTSTGRTGDPLDQFAAVAPSASYKLLSPGEYITKATRGELVTTKSGNRGYRVKFVILQLTEWVGQTVSRTRAFTPQAVGYAKRDLSLLGLDSSEKLLRLFPYGTSDVCKVSVAQRRDETGRARNDIVQFDAVRAEPLSLGVEGLTTGGETDFPFGANDGGTDL